LEAFLKLMQAVKQSRQSLAPVGTMRRPKQGMASDWLGGAVSRSLSDYAQTARSTVRTSINAALLTGQMPGIAIWRPEIISSSNAGSLSAESRLKSYQHGAALSSTLGRSSAVPIGAGSLNATHPPERGRPPDHRAFQSKSWLVSVLTRTSGLALEKQPLAPLRSVTAIDNIAHSMSPLGQQEPGDEMASPSWRTASSVLSIGNTTAFGSAEDKLPREQAVRPLQTGDQIQTGQSVLHLDGAALGRWAIQHLERALSRPANGITGIDPRATSPRGHVSPF